MGDGLLRIFQAAGIRSASLPAWAGGSSPGVSVLNLAKESIATSRSTQFQGLLAELRSRLDVRLQREGSILPEEAATTQFEEKRVAGLVLPKVVLAIFIVCTGAFFVTFSLAMVRLFFAVDV